MAKKKIYLVRHGETDFNKKGIVQGSGINSSLNSWGRRQADAFYSAYRHHKFDKIYTSALKRTSESVKKFIKKGIPHEVLPGLNEICWGIQEGREVSEESDKYFNQVVSAWQKGRTDLRIEGGDSPDEVAEMQKEAIARIMSRENEDTILICHHGRAMRILLCQLLHYPLQYMDVFEHTNLGLYELTFTGSMFVIDKFNDSSHLDILETM